MLYKWSHTICKVEISFLPSAKFSKNSFRLSYYQDFSLYFFFNFIADLYECATIYLTIHLLIDIFVFFSIDPLWIKFLWTFRYRFSCEFKFSFLWSKCAEVELLYHIIIAWLFKFVCFLFFFLKKLQHCFPEWLDHFTFPLAIYKWSSFSAPSHYLAILIG